jgi:ribonuclease J
VNAPNFVKLRQIGARGIDLLMSDSTHAMKEGLSKTESEIGSELHEIISKATGRIILSVSSNHIGRIRQIIESGEKLGRTVFLSGRNLSESIHMSRETGYI